MKIDKTTLFKRDSRIPLDSRIYVKDLSFSYDDKSNALKNISFDIKEGEYVSFIGHNGSGKSTLAKLIDGILVQNSGDIYIDGVLMDDKSALYLKNDIGIIFQNPDSQFIGATVKDDIAFGLENICTPPSKMDEIIKEAAKDVGMEDYLNYAPENLSGGQKQRVAIAGAICKKPNILILDEATAMLDPKGRREIGEIIDKMRKENPKMTIINITHMIEDAYSSSRVIVLNKGRLVMDGTPKEVFSNDLKLKAMHLDIPFAHKLNGELKRLGLNYGPIDSSKELINKICQ